MPVEQIADGAVDAREPAAGVEGGGGLDHPAVERGHAPAVEAHHSEPGAGDAGVDAHHDLHGD